MKLLNRLERRFAFLAVPNVTAGLISLLVVTYLAAFVQPSTFLPKIVLYRSAVLSGEVWRLATFVVQPPGTNPLFFIFFLMFFWMMGNALESHWGTFRYNLFLLSGYLATVAVVMCLPGPDVVLLDPKTHWPLNEHVASNAFVYGSVFLAFAWLYPDFPINLYFVLSVKAKWLALAAWAFYAFSFLTGSWVTKATVLASVANFFLFFGSELLDVARQRVRTGRRKVAARAAAPDPEMPFHVCAACGVTDKMKPTMEFRYCPQCAGTPGYCLEHFGNHVHR